MFRTLFNNIWASFIMFTRLPFWRLHTPAAAHFTHVVEWWQLTGWITGGVSFLLFACLTPLFGASVAAVIAIAVKILITGALHEDGLADFFDGVGGGHTPERILAIMKDSHIGTYGVLALLLRTLLMYALFVSLADYPVPHQMFGIVGADIISKSAASLLVCQLSYARKSSEAKTQLTYAPITTTWQLIRCLLVSLPLVALFFYLASGCSGVTSGSVCSAFIDDVVRLACCLIVPPTVAVYMAEALWARFLRRTINGYTGDCCGAVCLICETVFLLVYAAVLSWVN